MRVRHRVFVQTSQDDDGKQKLFYPDPELQEVVADGYDQQSSNTFSVAVSSNEDLSLGDLTAVKGLHFEASGDCDIKLNGSADVIELRSPAGPTPTTAGPKLFIEGNITQINVTNNDADTVLTGVFCVWGDPTP